MTQTTYSLAQLQAMTEQELINAFPQKGKRWIDIGYKVDYTSLIRATILAAKELHYPLTENSGCRERWYNPIKPILLKVERGRIEDPNADYSGQFERILSKMVKEGILAYADLGINDFRTLKETFDATQSKAQCWSNVLLFVEKDSAYVHLTPLKELFNINIISGGGWAHTAGIERQLRTLQDAGIRDVVVFTLTDYDPFGFAIDHEFVSKCETLGLRASAHHRIGINVGHTTKEILDVQKYPIKRGRHLTVEGICFHSNEWLAKYGIEGVYGLEIEAISAQLNGHQHLREIVAQELLKYLNESKRIDEITTQAWKDTPFQALSSLMYSIDERETTQKDVEAPTILPTKYISRSDYDSIVSPVVEEMEEETADLDAEIEDLEDKLSVLEAEKAQLDEPYQHKISAIQNEYWSSRNLLTYCLWQYFQKTEDQMLRERYDLGYPKGCLLDAAKEQKNLSSFLAQLNTKPLINDLQSGFEDAMNNGVIRKMIADILDGKTP